MLKQVDHVGIIVDDIKEARKFLTQVGMEHQRDLDYPERLHASFYQCGQIQIEVIEITEPYERERRLGGAKARIEHIAFEVDDLAEVMTFFASLGVKAQTHAPVKVGDSLNYWTVGDTSDGVVYQLIQRQG